MRGLFLPIVITIIELTRAIAGPVLFGRVAPLRT